MDQVPDVQTSWIKKLFGFTVLKPTERSTAHKMLMLAQHFRFALSGKNMPIRTLTVQFCVWFNLQARSPSLWLDFWT